MRMTAPWRRGGRFLCLAAGFLVAAVALAGCGSQMSSEQPSAPASDQRINLTTVDGSTIPVPGARPAVLFFFTPGCRTCEPAARELAAAHRQAGDDAQFLAIDINPADSPRVVKDFLGRVGNADLPAVVDYDTSLANAFDATALGTVVIIDSGGTATYRDVEPTAEQIVHAVRKVEQR